MVGHVKLPSVPSSYITTTVLLLQLHQLRYQEYIPAGHRPLDRVPGNTIGALIVLYAYYKSTKYRYLLTK